MKKTFFLVQFFIAFLIYPVWAQDNNRYMSMMFLNLQEDNNYNHYASVVNEAKAIGCNSVYVTVRWDITKCPSFQCISNPNVASDWRHVDNVIDSAFAVGINKIALRIQLGVNNAFGINRSGFLYGGEQYEMRDYYGNPYSQGYNNRMFSLAHQPTVDKARNFVTEVTQRYKYLQEQGKLLFISISITETQEGQYPPFAIYDYSNYMRDAFSNWHLAQYGTTAQPPINFDNEAGRRWYVFRHIKLQEFNEQMSNAIKSVDPNIKFITDFGSVYDGSNSKIGGTLGFPKLACRADGVKVNDAIDYNHRFAMDLLRTNLPNKWIMNELFEEGTADKKVAFLRESYQHGAKMVALVIGGPDAVNKFGLATQHPDIVTALQNPVPVITPTTTVNYSLSGIFSNPWGYDKSTYAQPQLPKNIVLNDDLLPQCPPNTCTFNLSIQNNNPNPVCGAAITLAANCTGSNCDGVTYAWSGKNISGSGNFLNVTVPAAKGNYTYTLTASKPGCSNRVSTGINVAECDNNVCAVNRIRLKFRTGCCQSNLVGAQIQGSNNGSSWDSLYSVSQNGNGTWQEFNFNNAAVYQQIRFVAGQNSSGELLEIEFYHGSKKLSGTLFGTGNGAQSYINAMDSDESTLWAGQTPGAGNYIGLVLKGCGSDG